MFMAAVPAKAPGATRLSIPRSVKPSTVTPAISATTT